MTQTPRKRWSSHDAFPLRFLALDLLASNNRDEEGNCYAFDFVDESAIGRQGKRLWFKVRDIFGMEEPGPEIHEWLLEQQLEDEEKKCAFRVLDRLYRVVHTEPTVAYYEETKQDIEHVLNIFIRRNSGGTVLSYSDLLLSIATSQWTKLDARKEVHQLVDELNRIGGGLDLTKDFVLKTGLMLTDIASVGFQVRNFTQTNMEILEEKWQAIRDTLLKTVQLVSDFGFDRNSIRATSALHPIAYYLYRIGAPSDFDSSKKYRNDRKAIRGWLIRSILKASGIWGSGLDTLLTALRDVIREEGDDGFPSDQIQQVMARRGKSLEFSKEEVEDLADMAYSDRRIFGLLALLSPFINVRNHQFHIDHVFPKSRFMRVKLLDAGISEDQIENYADRADRVGNLQLLDGIVNREKQAQLPFDWMRNTYPDNETRRHYSDRYLLDDIPKEMTGFVEFYEMRRSLLQEKISELVKTA